MDFGDPDVIDPQPDEEEEEEEGEGEEKRTAENRNVERMGWKRLFDVSHPFIGQARFRLLRRLKQIRNWVVLRFVTDTEVDIMDTLDMYL